MARSYHGLGSSPVGKWVCLSLMVPWYPSSVASKGHQNQKATMSILGDLQSNPFPLWFWFPFKAAQKNGTRCGTCTKKDTQKLPTKNKTPAGLAKVFAALGPTLAESSRGRKLPVSWGGFRTSAQLFSDPGKKREPFFGAWTILVEQPSKEREKGSH